jgi:hypothetical protein
MSNSTQGFDDAMCLKLAHNFVDGIVTMKTGRIWCCQNLKFLKQNVGGEWLGRSEAEVIKEQYIEKMQSVRCKRLEWVMLEDSAAGKWKETLSKALQEAIEEALAEKEPIVASAIDLLKIVVL